MESLSLSSSGRSTPQEILHLLKLQGGATVGEIGSALRVTTTAIRQHLTLLEKDSLVCANLQRRGMGRPSRFYSLTEKGEELFPRAYHDLLVQVLDEIQLLDGEERLKIILHRRAARLAGTLAHRVVDKDLAARAQELCRYLNELGALADLEEAQGRFRLRECNCLLYKVAVKFPQICDSEASLFSKVLGVETMSERCRARGDPDCVFSFPSSEQGPATGVVSKPALGSREKA